ncbi:pyridoxal phosphate-dependent aminotransferase [Pseudoroseomonas cervicalis]|uniref:pyridoxal phosphate-dependent aminotransferase n=1 Tax=Teichococcus cervicalis TaxID=204525 RepID=UPI0027801D81|nr:pyridoxal phosphate-dependent aminotransferase [Pseudoroseomonas cervicalis]MDQ1078648.1 aspartate/methionine/tyrosine aminotransferase [Pseudoroseomonas cervicalis]
MSTATAPATAPTLAPAAGPGPAPGPFDELPARIRELAQNQIAEIADLAREDPAVIKLWIGEGDLPTPPFVVEAAAEAMRAGHTRYTYALGLPRLRQALSDYHRRHWGVEVPAGRFTVTTGGMNAIMQGLQAVLSPGEEVIYPAPHWPNLAATVQVLGGVPVPVALQRDESGGFRLDLAAIEAAITPRTRVIAINSPSNPTGWVMGREQMMALRDLARARGLWILSDEVYNHFTYGNAIAPSFLEICDGADRLLVSNTFSKNWAMTGWRAGWLVFPEGLAATFDNLSQYNTTSIPTFIQHACIAALEQGDDFIGEMVARCRESRRIFSEGLAAIPGVRVQAPEGSFYLMFSVDGETDSRALAVRILRQAKVGLAPGTAFGEDPDGKLRLCFAVSPALAREAMARLDAMLRAG